MDELKRRADESALAGWFLLAGFVSFGCFLLFWFVFFSFVPWFGLFVGLVLFFSTTYLARCFFT